MPKLGLDARLLGCALLLTGAHYVLMNAYLTRKVDVAYFHTPASTILRGGTVEEQVSQLVDDVGADARIANEPFVKEAVRSLPESAACRDLAMTLIQSVQNTLPPSATVLIDRHMTGRRSGWPFMYLSLQPVSGMAVIEDCRNQIPEWSHKNALVENDASPLKAKDIDGFLAKVLDRVAQVNRAELRGLMRISGSIQWLTILVFWVVLLLCLRRFWMLSSYFGDPGRETVTAPAPARIDPESADAAQQHVYGVYEFLIGLLPSLGFIGTVLGMGDALLTADGLFSSSDKAQAIAVITKHLGFAFDTTLVGLVTGIICGASVLALRTWENKQRHLSAENREGGVA